MKEINNDIKENFCSFEVCKLLKIKGFGVKVQTYYSKSKEFIFNETGIGQEIDNWNDSFYPLFVYSRPTHSLAIEWLNQNFGIHIHSKKIYQRSVLDQNGNEAIPMVFSYKSCIDSLHGLGIAYGDSLLKTFETSNEAVDEGLFYALTNLIK